MVLPVFDNFDVDSVKILLPRVIARTEWNKTLRIILFPTTFPRENPKI